MNSDQERWLVGIMLSVTLVKLLLVMYCRSFTNEIVKAYAQDHFFDVITNIIGLIAALLANYVSDWMDPVGAIIVSTTANFFHAFAFWWLHIRYPIRLHVSDRVRYPIMLTPKLRHIHLVFVLFICAFASN